MKVVTVVQYCIPLNIPYTYSDFNLTAKWMEEAQVWEYEKSFDEPNQNWLKSMNKELDRHSIVRA